MAPPAVACHPRDDTTSRIMLGPRQRCRASVHRFRYRHPAFASIPSIRGPAAPARPAGRPASPDGGEPTTPLAARSRLHGRRGAATTDGAAPAHRRSAASVLGCVGRDSGHRTTPGAGVVASLFLSEPVPGLRVSRHRRDVSRGRSPRRSGGPAPLATRNGPRPWGRPATGYLRAARLGQARPTSPRAKADVPRETTAPRTRQTPLTPWARGSGRHR